MRVEVFGPLRVCFADRTLVPRTFTGLKPKQLLEILVAERGHFVSKARLADLLWPQSSTQSRAAALETYVSTLRQTLEPGVAVRESVIVTEPGGYRLDVSKVTLDLEEFDALVASAAQLPPVQALTALRSALALVRGTVLEDEPDAAWAEQARAQYGRRHVQALVETGRLALFTGEVQEAYELARVAVELEPLAEPAYQVLMTAAYALFRQQEALAAFDRCRTLLADELGVDPLDETVALHLAILRHEDVAALVTRAHPTARPAAAPSKRRLPLLGRSSELAQLRAALADAASGRFSLALITGDRGVGKSRLVEALLEEVEVPVGSTRCSDLEAELPYVALSLALQSVLDDAHGAVPVLTDLLERADRAETFDNLSRLRSMEWLATCVEQHSPFVLLLDDAHWADPESLAALGYLRRRCSGSPVLVLLTSDRAGAQEGVLRRLPVDLRLDLGMLDEDAVAPLGSGAFAATRGHPTLVADWASARQQGLDEPFTPLLQQRVLRLCWGLGPQTYRLVTLAALLDQPFTPEALAQVVDTGADIAEHLELAVDEQVLSADADGYRFAYDVVRETLAALSSPGRVAQVRARAARTIVLPEPRHDTVGHLFVGP